MKIRRKDDHSITAEAAMGCGPFHGCYVHSDLGLCNVTVYSTEYWEPVPDKQWRNVTAECEVEAGGRIVVHLGACRFRVEVNGTDYRARKVRCARLIDASRSIPAYETCDAFIIEKES